MVRAYVKSPRQAGHTRCGGGELGSRVCVACVDRNRGDMSPRVPCRRDVSVTAPWRRSPRHRMHSPLKAAPSLPAGSDDPWTKRLSLDVTLLLQRRKSFASYLHESSRLCVMQQPTITRSPPGRWVRCPVCLQTSGTSIRMPAVVLEQYFECHNCDHEWKVAPPPQAPSSARRLAPTRRR